MSFSAIIVAAGSGQRAGLAKQWAALAGRPVARWSVEAMLAAGARQVVVVHPPRQAAQVETALAGLPHWLGVEGGARRIDSVLAGLAALDGTADEIVLVHDAARPFVSTTLIGKIVATLDDADGAVPVLPVADSLKRAAADGGLHASPREGLLRAQTPQGFRKDRLIAVLNADDNPTDDASAVEAAGGRVVGIPGDPMLFKLTYPEDLAMAQMLADGARLTRVGQGVDAHRLGPGDGVWLCGVKVPFDQALVGHSDADVALHALTDALLGAIGEGDIGLHFPPTDPRWRGMASARFVERALELVAARGGRVVNIDITLICEAPKVGPHRQAMRESLATMLDLPVDRISVKATTTEKMGFTGRGEGIAAQALAVVETPI